MCATSLPNSVPQSHQTLVHRPIRKMHGQREQGDDADALNLPAQPIHPYRLMRELRDEIHDRKDLRHAVRQRDAVLVLDPIPHRRDGCQHECQQIRTRQSLPSEVEGLGRETVRPFFGR
jgi:hypothetical protein